MLMGRREELALLERYYGSEGSQILAVYGARGVGKTSLLREFAKGKRSVYYAARACSGREQRYQWARELAGAEMEVSAYPGYGELLAAVFPERTEKQLLILDEFQYLVKGEREFFGELVRFLGERRLSRPVMVILASSNPGWVENHLVERIGGDAVYIQRFLKVRELPFGRMRELFPGFSAGDALCIYAVLGGNPGLWKSFDETLSARENIIRHLLSGESRLYGELRALLWEELREPAVYSTILGAIAEGRAKLNDLFLHTGFSRAKISVYLKNLMELDLVEKVYAGTYRIKSPCVRFYFRFLYPHLSRLEELSPEEFYEERVQGELAAYVDTVYGQICRQICEEELPEGMSAAEWVGRGARLDIVAVDGQNRRMAALCSYSRVLGREDYRVLLKSARKAGIEVDRACLFGEAGFTEELRRLEKRGKVELRSVASEGLK